MINNGTNDVVERRIIKEIQKSMIKNFLKTVVMVRLRSCGPLSGYSLMDYVHKKFDVLISPGTVYSLLYSLERKGLLKAEFDSGKRLYSLTDKGLSTVETVLDSTEDIKQFVGTLLQN
jgi:DNA-binding PadR family transcriptional regulator